MFKLDVNDNNEIEIIENGNTHTIPLEMEQWSAKDLKEHWGTEIYGLLDGYYSTFLFLGMTIRKEQGLLRAFRAVRIRDDIVFDEVLIVSPWKVRGWNPMDMLQRADSTASQTVYDYEYKSPQRLPEFSVSASDVRKWQT
ncbi:MAG: hypothetical protein ACI978_002753 [Oleispira sp.]|jgi:hypothetical protein